MRGDWRALVYAWCLGWRGVGITTWRWTVSRIKPRRDTPRRRAAPRWTAEEWTVANVALERRAGGRCEMCGGPRINTERHHRQKRTVGGDRLANILLLHQACHQYVTEHPELARARGLIVSNYAPDSAAVPVLHGVLGWVLLDDDGNTQRAQAPAERDTPDS